MTQVDNREQTRRWPYGTGEGWKGAVRAHQRCWWHHRLGDCADRWGARCVGWATRWEPQGVCTNSFTRIAATTATWVTPSALGIAWLYRQREMMVHYKIGGIAISHHYKRHERVRSSVSLVFLVTIVLSGMWGHSPAPWSNTTTTSTIG